MGTATHRRCGAPAMRPQLPRSLAAARRSVNTGLTNWRSSSWCIDDVIGSIIHPPSPQRREGSGRGASRPGILPRGTRLLAGKIPANLRWALARPACSPGGGQACEFVQLGRGG